MKISFISCEVKDTLQLLRLTKIKSQRQHLNVVNVLPAETGCRGAACIEVTCDVFCLVVFLSTNTMKLQLNVILWEFFFFFMRINCQKNSHSLWQNDPIRQMMLPVKFVDVTVTTATQRLHCKLQRETKCVYRGGVSKLQHHQYKNWNNLVWGGNPLTKEDVDKKLRLWCLRQTHLHILTFCFAMWASRYFLNWHWALVSDVDLVLSNHSMWM